MSNTPAKANSYDISNSDAVLALADDLQKFIKENNLVINLQGKEYPLVEAWQYMGSRLGILPIVEELSNLSDQGEVKYRCQVRLLNLRTNQNVGAGFAICSNKEPGKKYFQEYAIASMSQTRAIGKAYRLTLGWLVKAAGYEATPYEEMEAIEAAKNTAKAQAITAKHTDANPVPPNKRPSDPEVVAKAEQINAATRQKAHLLMLANAEVISPEEREKVVMSINKLTSEKAQALIEKMEATITQRRSENPLPNIDEA